ncbi:MAG TPA: ATP-binding protein [Myxococcales bacterium]|nr:ATP-binding protein [Myxococcales bacterium]
MRTDAAIPVTLGYAPPEPRSIEETGLTQAFLNGLTLKHLYAEGLDSGLQISRALRLPWGGVMEHVFNFLAQEQLVELRGGKGFGRASVTFSLTTKGREAARDAMSRSGYAGPAPVPLSQYTAQIVAQSTEPARVDRHALETATSHLVYDKEVLDSVGPAMASARALFLFGDPGNGKTALAEALSQSLGGAVAVPHAVEVDGQVIVVFDSAWHIPLEQMAADDAGRADGIDERWMVCRRPFLVVGGELTLDMLDLAHNRVSNVYEAPCQMKANGGMLLVDDFGRQRTSAREMLNRWIIPLEKHVDLLSLQTGRKFEVPMEEVVVFSTNLDPQALVDEAFLRRIKYKVHLGDPTPEAFREIFRRLCEAQGIAYKPQAVDWLIEHEYQPYGRALRACHPRDILQILSDIAAFKGIQPTLSSSLLDHACELYFAAIKPEGEPG